MMRRAEDGRHGRTFSGERRVLRAALVLGAAAVLGTGTAPIAHAAPAAGTVSTASSVAPATDPDAATAAIALLKATYFNDVDTKNWLALRALFTPGAVVDTTGSFGPYFPNRDPFVAFTSLTLSAINTRHQGYDPQIDLSSDTTASAVWTMQDRLSLAGLVTIHGYGHYTDTYEEVDGQWRITYSKLTRTGFALEFPAFQNFATGLADAYKSGGPVAALLYVGPGVVNIPVSAVKQLVGAIASNFGGTPAKAQPITVPPGSTGVTTEPPGVTVAPSTASAATSSAKTVALRTSKRAQSIKPGAAQSAGKGEPQMSTAGATATASSTTNTTADTATNTPASQNDSTASSSASHRGAGHEGADNAKPESESSSRSQR